MTLRQRLLAIAGAMALLGATLSTGLGSGDNQATSSVTILPGGPLSAMLVDASVGTPGDDVASGETSGSMVLRVCDVRGFASGWTVSLSAGDFTGPAGHIGADQLSFMPGDMSVVRGNPDITGHATYATDPVRAVSSLLWTAPNHSGDGEYDLALTGTLRLPGDGRLDAFIYTVVVNMYGSAP